MCKNEQITNQRNKCICTFWYFLWTLMPVSDSTQSSGPPLPPSSYLSAVPSGLGRGRMDEQINGWREKWMYMWSKSIGYYQHILSKLHGNNLNHSTTWGVDGWMDGWMERASLRLRWFRFKNIYLFMVPKTKDTQCFSTDTLTWIIRQLTSPGLEEKDMVLKMFTWLSQTYSL